MSTVGPSRGTEPSPGVIYNLAQAHQKKAENAAAPSDLAGITPAGQELSRANAIVAAMRDARTERVESLKKRIETGQYEPDPSAIARRLLGD